jgi:hypothetical protein
MPEPGFLRHVLPRQSKTFADQDRGDVATADRETGSRLYRRELRHLGHPKYAAEHVPVSRAACVLMESERPLYRFAQGSDSPKTGHHFWVRCSNQQAGEQHLGFRVPLKQIIDHRLEEKRWVSCPACRGETKCARPRAVSTDMASALVFCLTHFRRRTGSTAPENALAFRRPAE